jgi:hypothetical protein
MDIFNYESARRIGYQNVLRKVDALMDWSAISVLLKNGLKLFVVRIFGIISYLNAENI